MAAGAGYYDANALWIMGEADTVGPNLQFSELINKGIRSVSTAVPGLVTGSLAPAAAEAIAAAAAAEDFISGEQTDDDEFTVRFDDGEPFITANEEVGIHDTKIAGVDFEQIPDGDAYAFKIGFRNPENGLTRRQFAIKNDGSVEVAGAELATVATKYKPVQAGPSRSIVPGTTWSLVGHSMADQLHAALAAALAPIPLVKNTVGGETSRPVAWRQGGQPIQLLPAGGSIPASGPVNVTLSYPDGPPTLNGDWPMLQSANSYPGALVVDGVRIPGTFSITRAAGAPAATHDPGDTYQFTRTTAGAVITANRPSPFYTTASETQRENGFIFWSLRNNYTETEQAVGDLEAMILHAETLAKRYLVIGEVTGRYPSEVIGQGGATALRALNTRNRRLHGRRFIDILPYLITYGLADAGINPTAQDTQDIADGIVPVSLRSDNLHLNAAGTAVVVKLIIARLKELGWI